MRAVIISGGSISDYNYIKSLIQSDDLIVCADSGYNHARAMGIIPNAVVGDFDSADYVPDCIEKAVYPTEKNYSDTDIAYHWARERGADSFLFLAAAGTRLDHSLANIFLLRTMLERGEQGEIADEKNRIMITNSSMSLDSPIGSIVSVIPLVTCRGVSNSGFKYKLDDEPLFMERSRGLSNIVVESPAVISVRDGIMLVIETSD